MEQHPSTKLLISSTSELEDICEKLVEEKPSFIAVDTEFIRNNTTYYPKLSLIQISYYKKSFIVDVLASGMNLSVLETIMLDKKIVKVFHSCKQDMESLLTLFHDIPSPIFDTQIAAMFCNYYHDFIGYSKLVKQCVGIDIDKIKAKNSNWLKRPLSDEQLDYAINDVIYLYDLYQILLDKLEKNNKMLWFQEEICMINNIKRYVHNPKEVWKKINFNCEATPITIKAIVEWREVIAQKYNINRNMVINNAVINNLVDYPLDYVDEVLDFLKQNTRNIKDKDLLEFINIFNENDRELTQYNNTVIHNYDKSVFDILSIILESRCKENNISRKLVISKEDMAKSISGLTDILFRGWRYDFFGKSVESFINSDLKFKISIERPPNGTIKIQSEESAPSQLDQKKVQ